MCLNFLNVIKQLKSADGSVLLSNGSFFMSVCASGKPRAKLNVWLPRKCLT